MRRAILCLTLPLALGCASAALGSPASQALADCNAHGKLTHSYSITALRTALATMPADMKEYTNCSDVIQRALLDQVGGVHASPSSASTGSGGSFLPGWLIVVVVLLGLAALTLAAMSLRRRRTAP